MCFQCEVSSVEKAHDRPRIVALERLGAPPADEAPTAAGRVTYVALCAGCHGFNGDGVPNTVVPMRGNTMLRLANPRNVIVSMLDGIAARGFPYLQRVQAMPPFADKLSDAQAAELANDLRVSFGEQSPDVTPTEVRALR